MSTSSGMEAADLTEAIEAASQAFDQMCQDRHDAGAKEYGAITFLGNDVMRMMIEEMVDVANYARMQVIKLLLLQGMYEEQYGTGDSFKGTKEGWKREEL